MSRIILIISNCLLLLSPHLLHAQNATYLGLEGGAAIALSTIDDKGGLVDSPDLSDRLNFYYGIQLMTPVSQKYMMQLTYAGIYKSVNHNFKDAKSFSSHAGMITLDSRDVGIRLMRKVRLNDRFTLLPLAGIRLQFTGPPRSGSPGWSDERITARHTHSGNRDTITVQQNHSSYGSRFNIGIELGAQLNYTIFSERFLLYTRVQLLQGLFMPTQLKIRYTSQELGETNTASFNYRGSGLFVDFGVAYRIFRRSKDELR